MAVSIERESTEYLYIGVTGNQPSTTQEVAFLVAAERPEELDWNEATLVNDDQHALWADASSAASGDWFLAILIGDFGGTGVSLSPGDYVIWIRLTDIVERPVRIAPVALEVT